jgi:hypothetical protein
MFKLRRISVPATPFQYRGIFQGSHPVRSLPLLGCARWVVIAHPFFGGAATALWFCTAHRLSFAALRGGVQEMTRLR